MQRVTIRRNNSLQGSGYSGPLLRYVFNSLLIGGMSSFQTGPQPLIIHSFYLGDLTTAMQIKK